MVLNGCRPKPKKLSMTTGRTTTPVFGVRDATETVTDTTSAVPSAHVVTGNPSLVPVMRPLPMMAAQTAVPMETKNASDLVDSSKLQGRQNPSVIVAMDDVEDSFHDIRSSTLFSSEEAPASRARTKLRDDDSDDALLNSDQDRGVDSTGEMEDSFELLKGSDAFPVEHRIVHKIESLNPPAEADCLRLPLAGQPSTVPVIAAGRGRSDGSSLDGRMNNSVRCSEPKVDSLSERGGVTAAATAKNYLTQYLDFTKSKNISEAGKSWCRTILVI